MFTDGSVIRALVELQASVSFAILDLSPGRAAVVRSLNSARIPVIAWLLLPMEQGYWFNLNNAAQAIARYQDFKVWTLENHLQWAGIGIDIEPDIRELEQFVSNKSRLIRRILGRILNFERLHNAQIAYGELVRQIHAEGYLVDSYLIPLIVDERRMGSTLLQRAAGLIDVPADREVLMLYTSFLRPLGPGVLWSYGLGARSIGLGSTGGGVQVAGLGDVQPLAWDEFSRDLRIASHLVDDLHIFSLEGCVQRGYLERLLRFNWIAPFIPPHRSALRIDRFRKLLRGVLWASVHPQAILIALLILLLILIRLRRSRGITSTQSDTTHA